MYGKVVGVVSRTTQGQVSFLEMQMGQALTGRVIVGGFGSTTNFQFVLFILQRDRDNCAFFSTFSPPRTDRIQSGNLQSTQLSEKMSHASGYELDRSYDDITIDLKCRDATASCTSKKALS